MCAGREKVLNRVYLCLGNRAGEPYEFQQARARVFSVEELCYFLKENAYLLEEGMLDKKLVEWIREECGLPDLAQKLAAARRETEPLQAFLEVLFAETGYYAPEEAAQAVRVTRLSAGVSASEKQKGRADYFLESHKYVLALQEYEALLGQMQGAHPVFLAKLYHNKGVAQAGLFLFEKAAASFEQAYRTGGSRESLIQYLGALRMSLSEAEYVTFLADHPELYEASLELESRWKERETAWMESPVRGQAQDALEARANGAYEVSAQLVGREVKRLEEEYREYVVQ